MLQHSGLFKNLNSPDGYAPNLRQAPIAAQPSPEAQSYAIRSSLAPPPLHRVGGGKIKGLLSEASLTFCFSQKLSLLKRRLRNPKGSLGLKDAE
jgi:hypothetical protein